ncbi:TonB-dependent receptor [Parabacteroides sp. PF5-6]|uniref:SusC/RagA family TonB-linked outer membrane protein n=1 Tax=Parabacteroides sp. PF5-6 TaxID=1742403 RepID=UPI002406D5E2|nr:TonB-dependent receptor [Parabacteroides sp. PF5-6]MDF9830932.1 TonB-linked SusC/RagA family outer membrane protein [Parabacteroides sp. PF5-6]
MKLINSCCLQQEKVFLLPFLILSLLFNSLGVLAQNPTFLLKGKVVDSSGNELPGVNIVVKNTTNGTSADINGEFQIEVSQGEILLFSFIGMKSTEHQVRGKGYIQIVMEEEGILMDEVIAIGYGTMKKRDITGAIASVPVAELQSRPNQSFLQMLQGVVPGVRITSPSGAKPDGTTSIRIRGASAVNSGADPLYVIDGFAGFGDLTTINPSDIESIEILKDASSTAIYGARGANGVILITTKRNKDSKLQIHFDAYGGAQVVQKKLDLLNATEFAEYANAVEVAGGRKPIFDNPSAFGKGTDWQDEIFRTAAIQNYQLSLTGGNQAIQYYISGNYFSQDGVIIGSGLSRGSLRINLDSQLKKWLKFGVNLTGSETKTDHDNTAATTASVTISPILKVKDENGKWLSNTDLVAQYGGGFYNKGNPVALADGITKFTKRSHVIGNAYFEFDVIEGMKLKINGGVDISNGKYNWYEPNGTPKEGGANIGGTAQVSASRFFSWQNENTLYYKKRLGENHSLDALIGVTFQKTNYENVTATARNFIDDHYLYHNLGLGSDQRPSSSGYYDWSLNSYLFRVNYGYKDRYLFTFSSREDGSSRFGEDSKYGFFPSGAFGWRISEEDFMKSIQQVNNLKLRLSAGVTGNQEIGNYNSLAQMGGYGYLFDGNKHIGIAPTWVGNPDLKWERTSQYDVGIDMDMFDQRVSIVMDYYYKKTTDMLLNVQLPYTSGFATSLQNIGSVENKGFEFSINTHNIKTKDIDWRTSFNISINRNEVLDLGDDTEIISNGLMSWFGSYSITRVGEPMGLFYTYKNIGIWQKNEAEEAKKYGAIPGDQKIWDKNNDGMINSLDREIVGNPHPDFTFGFNTSFRYKNWDMSLAIDGSYGNDIMNESYIDVNHPNGSTNQIKEAFLNAWSESNPSNKYVRLGSDITPRSSSLYIEDGSFLRIKNISLGYNFDNNMLNSIGIQRLRLFLSAENVYTFTNYSGLDPEANTFGSNNLLMGYDYNYYPQARTITGGLSLSF